MSYCENCKVEILDDTEVCPLCHSGLKKAEKTIDNTGYPDVMEKKRKTIFLFSVVLFFTLASLIMAFFFNVIQKMDLGWLYIIPASLSYILVCLNLFIREAGYLKAIFRLIMWAVILVIFIDYVTGFYRWSVNFVLPGAMLFIDVILIVLMFVNSRNYQGYMLYQIFMIVLAFIPVILIKAGLVTRPIVSEIAFLSAVLVFLGTLIIGGRTAREEMKRRFHI